MRTSQRPFSELSHSDLFLAVTTGYLNENLLCLATVLKVVRCSIWATVCPIALSGANFVSAGSVVFRRQLSSHRVECNTNKLTAHLRRLQTNVCYMILHCLRIQCRHAPKGCGKLLPKDELPAHLEKCPFERCKEQLANGRIDPIIKYFKKQVRGVGESSVMCGERPARVFGECPILAPPPLFCRHPSSAEACPH